MLVTNPANVAGKSKIKVTSSTDFIVSDGISGTTTVSIGGLAANETATLSVSGATLTSATDSATGALPIGSDGAVDAKNGYVTLALTNLTAANVTVTGTAKAGTKATGSGHKCFAIVQKPKSAGDK